MEIIFDFDGTIADTFDRGIAIVNRLADKYNYPGMGPTEIKVFREHGIRQAMRMMKQNGMSWIQIIKIGRQIHRELNKEIGQVKMFTGMKEVIDQLKNDGYTLGILSTNTKKNIKDFLRINKLWHLFDYVETCGVVFGKTRRLRRIMRRRELSPDNVIYIGDETRDIATCHKLGVEIVVVTWGFHTKKALEGYKPKWMVSRPEEILAVINKL